MSSIFEADFSNCVLDKVIVVDNFSTDDSLNNIDSISSRIDIVRNDDNYGFAKACNIGSEKSISNYTLFLNPDTIVFKDTFSALFSKVNHTRNDNVVIYGAQLLDDSGNIQRTCSRFPSAWNLIVRSLGLNKINNNLFRSYVMFDWDHKTTQIVDEVMGAFFLIKTDIFFKVKGFDERFFVYFEELDLSKRIYDQGYKAMYVCESKAFHKGGGVSEQVKAARLYYNLRSRVIYSFKHFGRINGYFIFAVVLFIEPILRIVSSFLKRNINEVVEIIECYKLLFLNWREIVLQGQK